MQRKTSRLLVGLLSTVLLLGACTTTKAPKTPAPSSQSGQSAQDSKGTTNGKDEFAKQNQAAQPTLPANYVGNMSIAPAHGPGGTAVTITATGLPANAKFDLVYGTSEGKWTLDGEEQEEYHGRGYTPKNVTLSQVSSDASGNVKTTFNVPKGYGYDHDIMLVQDGTVRQKANFRYEWTASIEPKSGPVGTPIHLELEGMGADYYSSTWQVLYDNADMGFLSSVSTAGDAKATITATGKPGKHFIELIIGSFQYGYLNVQESPKKDMPPIIMEFDVTDGPAVMPVANAQQVLPTVAGKEPDGNGPAIWSTVAQAIVGTPMELKGKGLPPKTELKLTWEKQVGSRVTNKLWEMQLTDLPKVTTDDKGNFSLSMTMPDDLGGGHTITALQGDKKLATTRVTITASPISITPASGPAGSVATILMKGVGWTETSNIYAVLYDNKDAGYVCGFSTQGTVHLPITLVGEPGVHYIDLVPALYKGKEDTVLSTFRQPQLNVQDHPGYPIPELHFAVTVTP